MDSIDLAKHAVSAAGEKKAEKISLIDLRGQSDLCEFQLICSGENDRQTRAIAQSIEDSCLKKFSLKPIAIEGKQSGHWIVLDYGFVIVHIFHRPIRDYYALESLWPNAKTVAP